MGQVREVFKINLERFCSHRVGKVMDGTRNTSTYYDVLDQQKLEDHRGQG